MSAAVAESIDYRPFGDAVILSVDDDSRKALLAMLTNPWTEGIANPFAEPAIAPGAVKEITVSDPLIVENVDSLNDVNRDNTQHASVGAQTPPETLPNKPKKQASRLGMFVTKIASYSPFRKNVTAKVEGVKVRDDMHPGKLAAITGVMLSIGVYACLTVDTKEASPQEAGITNIASSTVAPETSTVQVSRFTQQSPSTTTIVLKAPAAERMPAQMPESTVSQTPRVETVQVADQIPETPSSFDMVIVEGSNFTDTTQTLVFGDSEQAADNNPEVNAAVQQIIVKYARDHSMTLEDMNYFESGARVTIDLTPAQVKLKRHFDLLRNKASS